jgi:hypothetical protein
LYGVDGDTDSRIRFRGVIGVGHGATILGARSELVAGIGTIRTAVADDVVDEQWHWYRWQGITLSIRPSRFPVSGQFEVGRHRLPDRNVPVAAPVIWQRFMRLGISLPILG